MADIIVPLPTPAVQTVVAVKTRAKRIHIENCALNPNGSAPDDIAGSSRSVMFEVEDRDVLDNGFYALSPARAQAPLRRELTMAVLTQVSTITDPVTGVTVSMSVAGVAKLIEEFFSSWWAQDHLST